MDKNPSLTTKKELYESSSYSEKLITEWFWLMTGDGTKELKIEPS